MTHRVIIVDDNAEHTNEHDATKPSTRTVIPIPHGSTPRQIGELVEKVFRALDQLPGAH